MEMHQGEVVGVSAGSAGKGAMGLGVLAIAVLLMLEPSIAAAAPWDDAVRNIASTLTGTLGKTIAVIAVIVLGMMAMGGRLEWMTAIKVVGGIVIMFSAAQIVNWIAPGVGASIDAPTEQVCKVKGGAWIQKSILVADAMGVVSPEVPAHCVDASQVVEVCAGTVVSQSMPDAATQKNATANNRNVPTYYTGTKPGDLTCSS